MKQAGWRLLVKTAIDRSAALAGLVVCAPVLIATGVAIRATMGKPALFFQQRPGRFGRTFHVVKFRTMRHAQNASTNPIPAHDQDRLTSLGRFLRRTSLDELPQLYNVLRGELSLVGPRPLLMQYMTRYSPEQARRHDVLPGITGWAQVNGRNALSWKKKLELDVWYADHWSLGLDARILALTLWRVVKSDGISREGHATVPEFMGQGDE
jgi:lipopolysaccharide/colanic/teichoic acid biosynthesis glycosyltransferase